MRSSCIRAAREPTIASRQVTPRFAEQIAREFAREEQLAAPAVGVDDIPRSYEAITDEWLTAVLCGASPEARVIAHRLGEPDDGGTNRRRIDLTLNDAGRRAGVPASVFCKASHSLDKRIILAELGFTQGEVTFYRQYRELLDIDAPVCLLAAYDPVTFNSILVFDDLVRLGAEFCDERTNVSIARARSQLALLARLHGRFLGSDEVHA